MVHAMHAVHDRINWKGPMQNVDRQKPTILVKNGRQQKYKMKQKIWQRARENGL